MFLEWKVVSYKVSLTYKLNDTITLQHKAKNVIKCYLKLISIYFSFSHPLKSKQKSNTNKTSINLKNLFNNEKTENHLLVRN